MKVKQESGTNPLVSVIIPAYNAQQFITGCLERLMKQTYTGKWEIIVADNGSTDNTPAMLAEFDCQVVSVAKRGAGAARNAAFRLATGSIILFVDADCLAEPDLIASHVTAHLRLQEKASSAKIVGGSICGINNNYWSLCDDFCSWARFHANLPPDMRNGHCPTANMSVQRDIFELIGGFDEDLLFGEDFAFCGFARKRGIRIWFEPRARVNHINRTSFSRFISHASEWSSSAYLLAMKGLFLFPGRLKAAKIYIGFLWLFISEPFRLAFKAGRWQVLLCTPFILLNRFIFWAGLISGSRKGKRDLAQAIKQA